MRIKLLLVAALFPLAPSALACSVPMQNCGGEGQVSCSAVWERFNECKRAEQRGTREAQQPARSTPAQTELAPQAQRSALVVERR